MRFLRRTDLFVPAGRRALAVGGGLVWQSTSEAATRQGGAVAEIYYESKLVMTVDLAEHIDRRFSIPQKPNVVFHEYADGSIRFEESDCPDKVCIHAGRLRTVGQFAACLPNAVTMKIEAKQGRSPDDPEIIAG